MGLPGGLLAHLGELSKNLQTCQVVSGPRSSGEARGEARGGGQCWGGEVVKEGFGSAGELCIIFPLPHLQKV